MKNKTKERQRGSALAIAIILSTAIFIVAGSLLRHSVTEMKVYQRHALRIDARNAAESITEYAIAEIINRVESETLFNETKLKANPITLSDALKAELFAGSNIDYSSLEIKATFLNDTGEWITVSNDDPAYAGDTLAGKRAWVRTLRVSAKAKATEGGEESIAYVTNKFLVRNSPLLNYAIFYNMDAEFYPADDMSIFHHVHINGSLYTGPNKDLDFLGNTTIAGDFFVQRHVMDTSVGNGIASFQDIPSRVSSTLYDSNHSEWGEGGYPDYYGQNTLVTDVDPLTPVGTTEYIPDDPTTADDETNNSSYAIVEPILPKTIGGVTNDDFKGDQVRDNKIAYEAGLILKVDYNMSYNPLTQPANEQYVVNGYKYNRAIATDPTSAPAETTDGDLELIPVGLPEGLVGNANATLDAIENPTSRYPEGYSVSSSRVDGGAYDLRQGTGMDMFTIDMSVLAKVVNDGDSSAFVDYDLAKDWNGVVYFEFPTSTSIDPLTGQFAKGQSGGRADKVVKAVSLTSSSTDADPFDMGLQIINGENLPRAAADGDEGFTLGVNGPLYTIGHYNADGVIDGDSDTNADVASDGTSHDVSAALVSDTYTLLSTNWVDGRAWSNSAANGHRRNRVAVDTEVSAALITGSTPTRITSFDPTTGEPIFEGGTGSAGVQNFIRKHESWGGGKKMAYRGALVSLFHSEAHPNRLKKFYNTAPVRPWGYHSFFSVGNFPPGLPLARDYLRTQYRMISPSEYAAL